jgi:hypothetical protein
MARGQGPGPQLANFEWEPRWHANPTAICASLDEEGDKLSLYFCAGVIRMTQKDRMHVVNQLRIAASLLGKEEKVTIREYATKCDLCQCEVRRLEVTLLPRECPACGHLLDWEVEENEK